MPACGPLPLAHTVALTRTAHTRPNITETHIHTHTLADYASDKPTARYRRGNLCSDLFLSASLPNAVHQVQRWKERGSRCYNFFSVCDAFFLPVVHPASPMCVYVVKEKQYLFTLAKGEEDEHISHCKPDFLLSRVILMSEGRRRICLCVYVLNASLS